MAETGNLEEPLCVIVTGASSGLGRATAERLVSRGGRVALWARREAELKALAEELGDAAAAVPCDVADAVAVDAALEESERALGPVNGLVCAAGLSDPRPLESLDAEAWERTIDTNLSGTFFPCRALGQSLREAERSGSIVTVGSELSSMGLASFSAYCASKFGVIGLTKALAAELAPRVRVNALCPGPIDTPMLASEFELAPDPAEARRQENQRPPMQRVGTAEEIAAAAVWLLADATFATGSLVPIDGGTTAV